MTEPTDDIDPLTRLAIKHGTDKWGPHFYTPVYHELFAHLREKPVRLLEIGIGGYAYRTLGGNSLRMWADYFPHGNIVGIDIAQKTLPRHPRITTLVGSQDDPAFLARLTDQRGPFDIIIDDGSHVPTHVVASFYGLFPGLAANGMYVIEDVQTTFWPSFGGSILDGGMTLKLAHSVLEFLNHAEIKVEQPNIQLAAFAKDVRSLRAFHNIIVIEKGDNSEPSNFDYPLDNLHAARAVRMIEAELARAPTPEGFANLVDILARGRDIARAEALVAEMLAKWPDHPAVIVAAAGLADTKGDAHAKLACLDRMMQLEPDNETLRKFHEDAKTRASAAAPM